MSAKGAVGSVAQAGPMAPLIAARLPVIGLPTPSRSAARSPPHALFISAATPPLTRDRSVASIPGSGRRTSRDGPL